jgi:hypothetical protein
MVDPCLITNVLANDYLLAVATINRKYDALSRLAQLLEQLGDIQGLIPNIGMLVPVFAIDLSTYAALVAACPFLNLPAVPTDADLATLQRLVSNAYARLLAQLRLHPYIRMGALQAQLDKLHGRLSGILNQGASFLRCLQEACAAAEASVTFVQNAIPNAQAQISHYANNFVANSGHVLSDHAQTKLDQVNDSINQINVLMAPEPVAPLGVGPQISPVPDVPQIPLPPG